MELLSNNLAGALVFLGLAILAIEVLILGFSTFVLFFLGLATLLTGLLMYVGLLPETGVSAILSVGILTAASAGLLWKSLKKMQNKVEHKPSTNDLVGHSFILEGDVSSNQTSTHKYSGISWKVKSSEDLSAGTEVEVTETEVGAFTVVAKTA